MAINILNSYIIHIETSKSPRSAINTKKNPE